MTYPEWAEQFMGGENKENASNMGAEMLRFGNIGYTGFMKDDFEGIDKLEAAPEDKIYISRVFDLGVDGQEHGIALIDGVAHEFTSDLENRVSIPEELIKLLDEKGSKDVKLYHNHPNGTAPSGGDLEQLLRNRVKAIYTVGANGNIHKVRVGNDSLPSIEEYTRFRKDLTKELETMLHKEIVSGDMSIGEANYIFAKEQAYRIAMQYYWEYYGGRMDEIL
jgi:proteasome lid subunit RPN8/RPN11